VELMRAKVDHAAFDRQLLGLLREGQVREAATEALRVYGPEIYALLSSVHRHDGDGDDVFSLFCENLWKGLPGFQARSSFRTWAYAIAWHSSSRFRAQLARREPIVSDGQLAALALAVRTSTGSRLRKERHSRVRELRETLPVEDQMLLVLRIERELDWKDLSRVMSPDLEEDAIDRESARLRKRFQSVKDRLRAMIREDAANHL
jgi:RNA polymerase sigma-70 factor (ECF subfamily)